MGPGTYKIPEDISKIYAKCAVADGAGVIEKVATFPKRRTSTRKRLTDDKKTTRRKTPAPENKLGSEPDENKSKVEGPKSRSGGSGPKPRTLTSGDIRGSQNSSS